jgi:hypothetical protein
VVVNFFATQLPIQPSAQDKMCYSLFNKLPEEGFCAGTLVKIPFGYESIENLVVGDTVVDADGNQTEILAIARHYVDEYIRFYLNVVKNVQLLSVAQEKCLCDEQKSALRKIRDAELALLETQIEEIQFLLALHVNQLIDNVQHTQSLYDGAISDIQEAVAAWNNNFNVMTNEIALRLYKYDLLQEHLIYGVHQAIDE